MDIGPPLAVQVIGELARIHIRLGVESGTSVGCGPMQRVMLRRTSGGHRCHADAGGRAGAGGLGWDDIQLGPEVFAADDASVQDA